jgi:hypothetical protein
MGFVRNFLGVSAGNYGAIALSFVLNVVVTWRLGAEQEDDRMNRFKPPTPLAFRCAAWNNR